MTSRTLTGFALLLTCSTLVAQAEDRRARLPRPEVGRPIAPAPGRGEPIEDGQVAEEPKTPAWNQAQFVVVATVTDVKTGPMTMSMPPIHSNRLTLKPATVIRGNIKDESIAASHPFRGEVNYDYKVGSKYIFALSNARNGMTVTHVIPADEESIQQVTTACALPPGWRLKEGKPVSPWAKLGKDAWSAKLTGVEAPKATCSVTSRPALLAGNTVQWSVESVAPAKEIQWTNPDGDGEYRLTVTNPTDAPLTVPALLKKGDEILWNQSVIILCQGESYPVPGSGPVAGDVTPVVLKPGESLSTVVNVLTLTGPEWPRGGYRIEFTFCLGEKAEIKSLYYMSRHHDALRRTARDALKK